MKQVKTRRPNPAPIRKGAALSRERRDCFTLRLRGEEETILLLGSVGLPACSYGLSVCVCGVLWCSVGN